MTNPVSLPRTYTVTPADKRQFWYIMLPAFIEGIIMQLFGMIDTLMLGNTADSAVNIASVSLANTPHMFMSGILSAFSIGATTAIAFYTGQGRQDKIAATTRQTILTVLLVSLLIAVPAFIFAPQIVAFAGAEGELQPGATLYFRIIIAAYPIEILTVAATACMRGIGVTKIAMIYNITAGAFNVLGNYVLIYGKFGFPEMGVAGAALSTSLSKCISFAIAAWYMLTQDSPVRIRLTESFRFTRDGIGRVANVGITTALEQVLLQGGNVIACKIVAVMDTASIAAFNICSSINGLSWRPGSACQVASTTFTGVDLGEGRPEKARARSLMVFRYGMIFCAVLSVFLLLFRYPVAGLFTPEEEIRRLAGHALFFDAVSIAGITAHVIFSGSLRASGDQKYSLIASMISIWTARVVIAGILAMTGMLTVDTARLCVAIDQTIRGSIMSARFFKSDRLKARSE
ncbi:MAG: MATE family efflux transporter [Ruminococcaceae bacterium]|nr:MATE family efflux transporter [Oscillospiraceae bacterium]